MLSKCGFASKWRVHFFMYKILTLYSLCYVPPLSTAWPCNYWTPRAKRAGSYQTFTTFNRCTQKCHRKPPLLRGEQSVPWKAIPSLSRAKREKFPSLHTPYWCTQKCHRKQPLLRGEQSEPWNATPSSLSKAIEVSLSTYPVLMNSKLPQKPNTFERRAYQTLIEKGVSVM